MRFMGVARPPLIGHMDPHDPSGRWRSAPSPNPSAEGPTAPFPARVAKGAGESGVARQYRHASPAAFATHRECVRWTPGKGFRGWAESIP